MIHTTAVRGHAFKEVRDILTFLTLLTSSFDIFLSMEVAGFTVRAAQLFAAGLYLLALYDVIETRKFHGFEGLGWLCGFLALNLLFTWHTALPQWNVTYDLWLLSLLLLAVALWQLYRNDWQKLLALYLWSFALLAAFGVVQFIYGITNLSDWMITQMWCGVLPRINGFAFEPSYYATYLIVGWCLCSFLVQGSVTRFGSLIVKPLFVLLSLALALCSSRMAYFVIGIISVYAVVRQAMDLRAGRRTAREVIPVILWHVGAFALLAAYTVFCNLWLQNVTSYSVILVGIGEHDTLSITTRLDTWKLTWKVFLRSPVVGCGLGGVNAEVSLLGGSTMEQLLTTGRGQSGNIFLEILAATGVFGFLCVAVYGVKMTRHLFEKGRTNVKSLFLKAMVMALLCECFLLAMNQNVLRIYFWNSIGVLAVLTGSVPPRENPFRHQKKK